VTAQTPDEEALRDADACARALLEATTDAVVLFGPGGAVLARNALSRELLGSDDRLVRLGAPASVERWRDADGAKLAPEHHPAVLARSASGPVTRAVCIRRPDDVRRWVRASACVVADTAGGDEVLLVLSDITDLRTAHVDLARCAEELRRIATTASHDLGVPLAVLGRGLDAIEPGLATDAAAEGLREARAAAEVMRGIVGAVLSHARVDREVIEHDTVDLAVAAREIVTLLRCRLREAGAMVCVGELPRVTGNHVLLRQLLQNLVNNAIVHHPGPAPRVVIRSERRDGASVVIVEDDGDGIPECQRESVFGLFTRWSSAQGHGIGLAAAKRIVERHGGRIWIEDAVPQGARFCMTL
jgi:signal transduction histidine kinase